MDVGEEGDGGGSGRLYTYRYTVTTRLTSALRWAATRAILIFHNCEGHSHKKSPQTTTSEEKGEPKRIRTEVPLLTSLTPYRWAKRLTCKQSRYIDCTTRWLKCCFTATETVGLFETGAQDGHLDFHTAPELWAPLY